MSQILQGRVVMLNNHSFFIWNSNLTSILFSYLLNMATLRAESEILNSSQRKPLHLWKLNFIQPWILWALKKTTEKRSGRLFPPLFHAGETDTLQEREVKGAQGPRPAPNDTAQLYYCFLTPHSESHNTRPVLPWVQRMATDLSLSADLPPQSGIRRENRNSQHLRDLYLPIVCTTGGTFQNLWS
jgi:hypothetical protein